MTSFASIVESGFWQNPTDVVFLEEYFEEVNSQYIEAIVNKDQKSWDLSDKLKLIGKFFPIDDERNPDNPIYHR